MPLKGRFLFTFPQRMGLTMPCEAAWESTAFPVREEAAVMRKTRVGLFGVSPERQGWAE